MDSDKWIVLRAHIDEYTKSPFAPRGGGFHTRLAWQRRIGFVAVEIAALGVRESAEKGVFHLLKAPIVAHMT